MRIIQIKLKTNRRWKLISWDNQKTTYRVQGWIGLKLIKEMILKIHNLRKGLIKWENRWIKTVGYLKNEVNIKYRIKRISKQNLQARLTN